VDETTSVIHEIKVSFGQAFNIGFGLILGGLTAFVLLSAIATTVALLVLGIVAGVGDGGVQGIGQR